MNPLNNLKDAAQKAQKAVSSAVESKTKLVIDSALDAKDSAIGGVVKGVGSTWGVIGGILNDPIVGVGISIGMIAAPVPVGVGLGILWLLESQMKGSQQRIENHIEESKQRRTRERVIGLLKKYGEIPETAILETSLLRVNLNSKTGEITGEVKAGDYKGYRIEELDHHGLFLLIQSCNDDLDSKQVLETIEHMRMPRLNGSVEK